MAHLSLYKTSDIEMKDDQGQETDPKFNASFSTTDTDPSDYETRAKAVVSAMETRHGALSKDNTPKAPQDARFSSADLGRETSSPVASSAAMATDDRGKPMKATRYVSTQEAYDEWASIYDKDGNMLQSIDDFELQSMLSAMIKLVLDANPSKDLAIWDIGCGTGRNTAKLLNYGWPAGIKVAVTGLEMSKGMLDVAAGKLDSAMSLLPNLSLSLIQGDAFGAMSTSLTASANADALVSTLVLEHVPLSAFFRSLWQTLKPGGYALVTNMHPEMGNLSQAGFVAEDGAKVRGQSWAHTVEDTVRVAEQEGFEIVGNVEERAVEENMVGTVVGARGSKWVGVRVWYGMILKKRA